MRFIADLCRVCRSLEAVVIEYAPDAPVDGSEADWRGKTKALFDQSLKGVAVKLSLSPRRKRSHNDDFHDRSVDFHIRHAGALYIVMS